MLEISETLAICQIHCTDLLYLPMDFFLSFLVSDAVCLNNSQTNPEESPDIDWYVTV